MTSIDNPGISARRERPRSPCRITLSVRTEWFDAPEMTADHTTSGVERIP